MEVGSGTSTFFFFGRTYQTKNLRLKDFFLRIKKKTEHQQQIKTAGRHGGKRKGREGKGKERKGKEGRERGNEETHIFQGYVASGLPGSYFLSGCCYSKAEAKRRKEESYTRLTVYGLLICSALSHPLL